MVNPALHVAVYANIIGIFLLLFLQNTDRLQKVKDYVILQLNIVSLKCYIYIISHIEALLNVN
jgi:hypothetical protein